jgi:hypothetical protein
MRASEGVAVVEHVMIIGQIKAGQAKRQFISE